MLKKGLRIILRVMGVLLILLITTWILLWAYISYNKAGIIEKVKAGIGRQVKGNVEIKDISIDFFHNFPNVSVHLSTVSIRDSLWYQHHHDFLKAEDIYVSMRLLSLFSHKPDIAKVIVENAQVYYYIDAAGRSNLVKTNGSGDKGTGSDIPDFLLRNTRFIFDYPAHNKFHDIAIKELECDLASLDSARVLRININALVHGLGFNMQKGAYLKEKRLTGNFSLQLTQASEIKFSRIKLLIDDQPFLLSGAFVTGNDHPSFSMFIQTSKIDFKRAVGLLTQTTQQKFSAFNILQPMDITATLGGSTLYNTIPLAAIDISVNETAIETPAGRFNDCSFTGRFTNEVDTAKPRLDNNSMLSIKKFRGKWESIPLRADNIEVSNFTEPFLKCDLHSSFALAGLNDLTGSNSIDFIKGTGEMNIGYSGSLVNNDTIGTFMNGNIRLSDAEIGYLPRQMVLKNLSGNLVFKNADLFIEQLQARAGATSLTMNGSVRNLSQLLYADPQKMMLEWNITTPYLDLVDFISFLGKSPASKNTAGKNKLSHTAGKIDQLLENGTANLNIKAGKIRYKKFTATGFNTSVSLLPNKILVNSARLDHAGGSIILNGSLSDQGSSNAVKLKSTISQIDIPSLFTAFNNFGQDAITNQNMKGRLTADISLGVSLSDKAVINLNSLTSDINFSVLNGELNNFEPLQKISATVFKKRDFSKVQFAELKDKLQIKGSAISFNKMEISSNVFTMFVEGMYDSKNGTDMTIQVPTRNLKKMGDDEVILNKGRVGLNIRLRAKTGDDGKLKISWSPFGRSGKD